MTMSQKLTRKRYSLFVLAILLGLSGVAVLIVGPKYSVIRSFAGVAFIVGVYLIRVSNVHTRFTLAATSDQGTDSEAKNGRGRLMWIIGAALLPVAGASFFYLYQDALHGYHEVLPVYVFAGVAALCALLWSYLISKLLSGGGGKQGPRGIR